jgi:hypothetical protein
MTAPTHVMTFAGTGGSVESITLCGVEPIYVDELAVCKGDLELIHVPTLTPPEGDPIPAGLVLANRAAMEGRAGMRIEFGDFGEFEGVTMRGMALVLSAWLARDRPPGARLQVVVTYRPHLSRTPTA